jgi:ABC-type transport system substrate-binding protein
VPEVVDGGTVFNFTLRDNLNFHNVAPVDGRAVTAEDVKHSIDVFAAESPNRGNWLAQVDTVTVTGNKTFTITLKNPSVQPSRCSSGTMTAALVVPPRS